MPAIAARPREADHSTKSLRPEKSRRRAVGHQTLVLNADYVPVQTHPPSICSARHAAKILIRGKADVLEVWPQSFLHPDMPTPKIIILRSYVAPASHPKFCRRSIFLRDRFCCQYCGEEFTSSDLTYDHVIPRSRGGKTVWENVLTACIPCNTVKGDHMPNYSAPTRLRAPGMMRPLKLPRAPTAHELLKAGMEFLPKDIIEDFGSYLYWTAELFP